MSFGEVQLHVVHEHVSVERVKPAAGARRRVVRRVDTAQNASVAGGEHVLDMIDCGKKENAVVVPRPALDPGLSKRSQNLKLLAAYDHSVRAHESNMSAVRRPRHILGGRGYDFGHSQPLSAVEQHDAIVALAK